jgi:hypothetical protein
MSSDVANRVSAAPRRMLAMRRKQDTLRLPGGRVNSPEPATAGGSSDPGSSVGNRCSRRDQQRHPPSRAGSGG